MRFLLWLAWMSAAVLFGWHLGHTPPANNAPTTVATVPPQTSILGDRRPSLDRLRLRFQQDHLSPDTLPQRVLAAIERSQTGGSFEVQALLTGWFQQDREGLRQWLQVERRPQALYQIVARLWVREDLENAWMERDQQRWDSALLDALVELDPQALVTGQQPPGHIMRPSPDRIRDAAIRWAEKDFNAAAEAVRKGNLEGAVGLAEVKYRQSTFDEALRWADDFEPHRETALCAVIDQMAKEDPEKAMRHLSEYGITHTSHLAISNIQRALADRSAEEIVDLLRRYPVSIPSLYRLTNGLPADPRELEKLLEPIADRLAGASSQSISMWRPTVEDGDLAGTLDRLAGDPDNALRQLMLKHCLQTWKRDHKQPIIDWIASREDADERTRYAFNTVNNPSLPFEFLNMIHPDRLPETIDASTWKIVQGISTSMQAIATMDPQRAIARAEELEIREWRHSALNQIARSWSQHDEAATIEWLQSLNADEREAATKRLPDHIQQQLDL